MIRKENQEKKRVTSARRLGTMALLTTLCLWVVSVGSWIWMPTEWQAWALPADGSVVVDDAGVLSVSEYSQLQAQLTEISERQGMDVAVVTTRSMNGMSAQEYADYCYDTGGYRADGILLLISLEYRDWSLCTTGEGIRAFTDAGQDALMDKVLPSLSEEEYYQAFSTYGTLCDDYITQAKTGEPYDTGNLPKDPFPLGRNLLFALFPGFAVAWVLVNRMKNETQMVHSAVKATSYLVPGSVNVANGMEQFRYREFRAIQRDNHTGGGGSTTHMSSGGTIHGGSSGKF